MPDKDGNETFIEKLYRKCSKEPLVPLGSIATVAFLGAGLRAFHTGQKFQAQQLMRGRVLAQGFTVMVMMIGAYTGCYFYLSLSLLLLLLLLSLLLPLPLPLSL